MMIGKIDPTVCSAGGCPWRTAPITNADRIRAMSDEELANYIWQLQNTKARCCTNGWLDWLKEVVDDE